jgi:glucose/arabinose dehydrogenase/chitodextrinase
LLATRTLAAVLALGSVLGACGEAGSRQRTRAAPLALTPAFVQARAREITSGTTNSLAFNSANAAGNLVVVYAVWSNTGSAAISDSRGNTYASAQAVTRWQANQWSAQVFYARNVAAGANTVTATFGTAIASFGIIYIHEYSGIDKVAPLDVSMSAAGTTSAMNSGSATTTNASDLIFGAGASINRVTGAGSGFTTRSTAFGNRTEDRTVTSTGSYSATATQNANAWVMQMVAFKADPGTIDAAPPTVPTGLAATAVSTSQIDLTWNASTDDVGVTGYDVFRDGAAVATVGANAYSNSGLAAGTTYTYAVRARDGAGNLSALSATASATTLSPDLVPPTVSVTAPAAGATVSGTATVSANASDDVGVAGVQFLLDGANLGAEDTAAPYAISWDTFAASNGAHALSARARDAAGNVTTSSPVSVTVSNTATAGLAAGYAFDEGAGTAAADASGHGLTGTLTGGPVWSAGRYGAALSLDGIDDHVDLGNPTGLQLTGSMTVSAWIDSSAFPGDDAAIVSKRGAGGYQLDTTVDRGPRTIGFKLTTGSGADMFRYGATALQLGSWYHVAGVYDAAAATLNVYLNGQLDNGTLLGTVATSQSNSAEKVLIGQRASGGFGFNGVIDEVRIYARALTQAEVQADMGTPLGTGPPSDLTPPSVSIVSPASGAQVSDIVTVTADAADDVGVAGVQFFVDGVSTGAEDTEAPYGLAWDTRTAPNGAHALTARARDAAGNTALSAAVAVNVANTSYFQNEVLATGFNLPTCIKFLPDGRLLLVELQGTIRVLPPPYTQPDPTPFLQLTNVGSAGVQQGVYDLALDPGFASNHYYYLFYTLGNPNRDRLSRFTANATLTGTVAGSELVLYQDPQDASAEHHGGAVTFGNDGRIYFTTGEHFSAGDSQLLSSPRGKVHRINADGTVPTDNPFYDGPGPNVDSIWALGLRNPYRAFYDAPTGRLFIGDVGGNDYSTAKEEVNLGAAGANYGWPNSEGTCATPCTSPLYFYPHNGRDASITGGFVYRGSQFPSAYQGSYFFADYTQNWIRRLTLDAAGNLTGVFNFEPADGSVDGPYGDIVYLTEGPDGALYYVDLGYSDIGGTFGVSKIRRIRYLASNQAPVAAASASPTSGPAPLTVSFSSAGSMDPEGLPLTYDWTFGDTTTSAAANPVHVYTQAGQYTARLAVSDGVNTTLSTPLTIAVGSPPTATVDSPLDGALFRAGDVIPFSGNGTDPDDGLLPASAFTWNIDFLHEGHVHPGIPQTGVKSGSFTIPTSGHDFSGNTRYRVALTVADSSGLTSTRAVLVYPQKSNLTFSTVPAGLTLHLDGIARVAPFVYDTLIGFSHTVEARDQAVGATSYTFASWSDGGARQHVVVVPGADQGYAATYTASSVPPGPPTFVQVASATPQSPQSSVATVFPNAQTAGNLNVVVVGWNDSTSVIASVADSAGNVYQVAAPTTRGTGISQAVYYARNIVGSGAGANAVAVAFGQPAPYVDVRIAEYSGLDRTNPLDVAVSAFGSTQAVDSGTVSTTVAYALLVGAGTTSGAFIGPGSGYTLRVITQPDSDILEDRAVTSAGAYGASAPQVGSANWVMQMVAFRAAAP